MASANKDSEYAANEPEKNKQSRYSADNVVSWLGKNGSWEGEHSPQEKYDASQTNVAADFVDQPSEMKYPGEQDRLFRAVQRSYQALDGYREMNRKLVEEYGGTYYQQESTGTSRTNRYVNLIQQAVETYQMLLTANRPRVLIQSRVPGLRPFAKHFENALNLLIKEIHLEDTMSQWVMDAFFCVGIVKTHMADAGVVEIETDRWMDPGRPFASNIALDDFVYDMKANKWSEVRYAGDMYHMSYEDAVDIFGEAAMKNHVPRIRSTDDVDRVDTLSRGDASDADDFEDRIDFADIWVPKYGKVFTYVVQSRRQFILHGDPVAVEEWTGGEDGMYQLLGLGDVPENIMPSSPASHLEQLDALANDMWRKCSRQARRQKDVNVYTPGGAGSAQQIQLADDGEWVQVNDTSDVATLKQGGVDAASYAFLNGSMEAFDRMAGNLQTLSGLGSQEETARQAQMVSNAAGNKVDKMTKTVVSKTVRLVQSLGHLLWQDDFTTLAMSIPIEGTPFVVADEWRPSDRAGNFLDYNFDVDVYSMQYQSPQGRLSQLDRVVQTVILPMAPMLQQQGGYVDMIELTSAYSKLMNMPDLKNIVKFGGMPLPEDAAAPNAEVPRKAPTSTRNYVRHNVSAGGRGPMGQSAQMMGQAANAEAIGSGPSTPGGMT